MRRLLLILGLAASLSGCTFGRVVVNGHVKDLDTSWIRPGVTTRDEVVKRLGMPATVKDVGVGVTKETMRWVAVDTTERKFEGGYVVTPTFTNDKTFFSHDILIVFDDRDVVSLLSRTRSDGDKIEILDWREVRR